MNRRCFFRLCSGITASGLLAPGRRLAGVHGPGTEQRSWPARSAIIKIVGVGWAGKEVVNRLSDRTGEQLICCHIDTDLNSLARSKASQTLLLDGPPIDVRRTVLGGTVVVWSPPGRALLVRRLAWRSRSAIETLLRGANRVFVVGGLGGVTGGGLIPAVMEFAKAMDITPIVVGILPFKFEGRQRNLLAVENAIQLRERFGYACTLVDNHSVMMRQSRRDLSLLDSYEIINHTITSDIEKRIDAINRGWATHP